MIQDNSESPRTDHNFAPLVKDITDVEVVVAPGFTVLGTVKATLAGSAIQLAAQDCFWEQ